MWFSWQLPPSAYFTPAYPGLSGTKRPQRAAHAAKVGSPSGTGEFAAFAFPTLQRGATLVPSLREGANFSDAPPGCCSERAAHAVSRRPQRGLRSGPPQGAQAGVRRPGAAFSILATSPSTATTMPGTTSLITTIPV